MIKANVFTFSCRKLSASSILWSPADISMGVRSCITVGRGLASSVHSCGPSSSSSPFTYDKIHGWRINRRCWNTQLDRWFH